MNQAIFLSLLVVSGVIGSVLAHIIFFRLTKINLTFDDAIVHTMWFSFGAIFVAVNVFLAPGG